jgi:hypothetical protein
MWIKLHAHIIKRFIDPDAEFIFVLRATDASTMEDGIAFEGLKLVFKNYFNFEDICVN